MPTLHSHTITHGWFIFKGVREPQAVWQVAPAQSQAKTWQRVYLSNRTTKTTDNPADEKEHRTANMNCVKKITVSNCNHLKKINFSTFFINFITYKFVLANLGAKSNFQLRFPRLRHREAAPQVIPKTLAAILKDRIKNESNNTKHIQYA